MSEMDDGTLSRDVAVRLVARDASLVDLPDLEWTGSPTHLRAVEETIRRAWVDEVDVVVVVAERSGQPVALGAVGCRTDAYGELWMLSTHPAWQSLGVGRFLIEALEQRVRERSRGAVRLGVEHDNPRARSLYERLGYRAVGTGLDSWPVEGGVTYVTVVTTMEKSLGWPNSNARTHGRDG